MHTPHQLGYLDIYTLIAKINNMYAYLDMYCFDYPGAWGLELVLHFHRFNHGHFRAMQHL